MDTNVYHLSKRFQTLFQALQNLCSGERRKVGQFQVDVCGLNIGSSARVHFGLAFTKEDRIYFEVNVFLFFSDICL